MLSAQDACLGVEHCLIFGCGIPLVAPLKTDSGEVVPCSQCVRMIFAKRARLSLEHRLIFRLFALGGIVCSVGYVG